MKIELLKPINESYTTIQQLLTNRGIALEDIDAYLDPSENCLCNVEDLGVDKLDAAYGMFQEMINNEADVFVPQDADVDGMTSTAIFFNYIYSMAPKYAMQHIKIFNHEGKVHGLSDCYQEVVNNGYKYVWINDAGSNDVEQVQKLKEVGCKICIVDHHESEHMPDCIVINNQLSDYKNKNLSGAGLIWKVLQYFDKKRGSKHADSLIDLAALGILSDVMDMRNLENRYIVYKGIKDENVKNPLIRAMWQANTFKLGDELTPIGIIFYITPLLNAVCRSGTQEEKELTIKSMLYGYGFKEVESSERGCKGEKCQTFLEGVRVVNRVKRRQTKLQDEGMERLESKIQEQKLLDHKVLMVLLDKDDPMPATLRGLVASKLMGKYQRPCLILTQSADGQTYSGSGRGYTGSGIENLKDIWYSTGDIIESIGHQNAHGFSIRTDKIQDFLKDTDEILKDMSTEPVYKCDYIFDYDYINPSTLEDIGFMKGLWASAPMTEPIIAIKNVKISSDNVSIMKSNTIKISLPGGVSILKFKATDEEVEKYRTAGLIVADVIGKVNLNYWAGVYTPQIFPDVIDIKEQQDYLF